MSDYRTTRTRRMVLNAVRGALAGALLVGGGALAAPGLMGLAAADQAHVTQTDVVGLSYNSAAHGASVAAQAVAEDQAAKIVRIAKGEVGTTEVGHNCVPHKPYNICNPYCAVFATWVWREAGVDIPRMNYVPDVYNWAKAHDKWYGTDKLNYAKPGDMIIFGSAHNRYHIGIVDHVDGGTVHVISGNTANPHNSRQQGVYEKPYELSGSVFYGLVHL